MTAEKIVVDGETEIEEREKKMLITNCLHPKLNMFYSEENLSAAWFPNIIKPWSLECAPTMSSDGFEFLKKALITCYFQQRHTTMKWHTQNNFIDISTAVPQRRAS